MIELQNYNPPRYSIRGCTETIIGKSNVMLTLFEYLNRLADLPTTVLLTGETGTGKELCAKALHCNSASANGNGVHMPFVVINCAGIPVELLESELFGHVKGSFTGAYADKKGLVEVADDGTLFLDEIAEMHPSLQAKLLRMLQEHEINPVGGTKPRRVNARVIAATNKDLEQEIARGRFREDLFYRLNVFPLKVPPLRERGNDATVIAEYFVERNNERYRADVKGLADSAREKLLAHPWRGNIRELENIIERAFVIRRDGEICAEDIVFDCSKMPRIRAPGNEVSVAVASLQPELDAAVPAQQGSGLWYEKGVLPITPLQLSKMYGAKTYRTIHTTVDSGAVFAARIGNRSYGRRIVFLTPDNAQYFFAVQGEDFERLMQNIQNNRFNEVAKLPFSIFSHNIFPKGSTSRRDFSIWDEIERQCYTIPSGKGPLFALTMPVAEQLLRGNEEQLALVRADIESNYRHFGEWIPCKRKRQARRPAPKTTQLIAAPPIIEVSAVAVQPDQVAIAPAA